MSDPGDDLFDHEDYPPDFGKDYVDARLIAAAPELLEACKQTLMGLDLEFGPSRTDVNFPLLRAAIAKAEGRQDGD